VSTITLNLLIVKRKKNDINNRTPNLEKLANKTTDCLEQGTAPKIVIHNQKQSIWVEEERAITH
jgi:hypothetical protein